MSKLKEIEKAISSLSSEDQAQLVVNLPTLLTAAEGQLAWLTSTRDSQQSSAATTVPPAAKAGASDIIDADFEFNP